jgi:hypothetical protein
MKSSREPDELCIAFYTIDFTPKPLRQTAKFLQSGDKSVIPAGAELNPVHGAE